MPDPEQRRQPLLRDQQRALHAYEVVEQVPTKKQKDYGIAVNDLGANILRGGLCAALAAVQRIGGGPLLLEHIAAARVYGLENATAEDLAEKVRQLDVDTYMLATRETIHVATWLKRAVQATFEEA